jgi:catechol 2,3-dioxygenase-like lactoylglutathione lyase family enzyme
MPLGDPMGGQAPESERGKLLKIGQVWVPVSDLPQAVELYTEVLGLKMSADHRDKGYVELATSDDGAVLVLYLARPNDEEQPGIRTGIVFQTDSIYGFHKVLVDEGIEFTLKPQRDRNGRLIARFTDDDGNEFEVLDSPKN